MIIHFAAVKHALDRDYEQLREILDIITESGNTLTRERLDKEYEMARSSKYFDEINWWISTKKDLRILARADIVIVEATEESLSVGYQIATAVQLKKPVLILIRKDALSTNTSFGNGISPDFDSLATVKRYDTDSLRVVIGAFINENKIHKKDMRFNFFINPEINAYLKYQAHITGKNKSEILRDLVLREISK